MDFLNLLYLILGIVASAIAIIAAIIGSVKWWSKKSSVGSKQHNKSPIILPNSNRKQVRSHIKSRWVIFVVIIVLGGLALLLFGLPNNILGSLQFIQLFVIGSLYFEFCYLVISVVFRKKVFCYSPPYVDRWGKRGE